jgi:hypothetical protein
MALRFAMTQDGATPSVAPVVGDSDRVLSFPYKHVELLAGRLAALTAEDDPGTDVQTVRVSTGGGIYLTNTRFFGPKPRSAGAPGIPDWLKKAGEIALGVTEKALPILAQTAVAVLTALEDDDASPIQLRVQIGLKDPRENGPAQGQANHAYYYTVTPTVVRGAIDPSPSSVRRTSTPDGIGLPNFDYGSFFNAVGSAVLDVLSASLPALANGRDAFIRAAASKIGEKVIKCLDGHS